MLRSFMTAAAALASLYSGTVASQPTTSREQLNAILWFQTSPERQALSRQAYAEATAALKRVNAKNAAIVLDIDETVLDNSPYNAGMAATGGSYTDPTWNEWVLARKAQPLPGAREFIHAVIEKKLRIVFISNRFCDKTAAFDADGWRTSCPQRDATIENIESALGYRPAAGDVLLRYAHKDWNDSDKSLRRSFVEKHNRIAMLIGDDLGDFVSVAGYKENEHRQRWGSTWFALPNPMYGSWDKPFGSNLVARYKTLSTWSPKADPIKISSWNMEWLAAPASLEAANFWSTCAAKGWPNEKLQPDLPYCNVLKGDGLSNPAEYEAKKLKPLRETLASMAAEGLDILAVQEVQSAQALQTVLPPGYSVKCFTGRLDPQNVGIAVRDAAPFTAECKEYLPLSLEQVEGVPPVRRGLELKVSSGGKEFKLLTVHFKSRCVEGRMTAVNDHCPILQRQVEHLEAWIEEQGRAGTPFMVIGDWNRDIEAEVRHGYAARSDDSKPDTPLDWKKVTNLFPEVNDGDPAESKMTVVPVDRRASSNKACHDVLDHIAVSDSLLQLLEPDSLIGGRTLQASLQLGKKGSSDHCRLETTLILK